MRTVLVAAVCSAVAGLGMAPSSVLAKTVNECRAEWQAHKDIFQPKGISEHDYIDECRGFPAPAPETPAATNAAPAAAVPAKVKPARAAVPAPVEHSEKATTRHGADNTKKPEDTKPIASRDELKPKVSQESNRSARDRNPQLGAVESPPPAPSSGSRGEPPGGAGSCLTRSSGTIIHGTARCP
jgi:hypothetical protein